MASAESRSTPSGFSQKTGSPRSTAACTRRWCSEVQVHTNTASQPSSTSSSEAQGVAPLAAAKPWRRASSGSHTPAQATSAPDRRSILEWNVPISPAPRNPTRTVTSPEPDGEGAALDDALAERPDELHQPLAAVLSEGPVRRRRQAVGEVLHPLAAGDAVGGEGAVGGQETIGTQPVLGRCP